MEADSLPRSGVRDGELTIEVPGATLNPLCPTDDRDRWTAGKGSSVEFNFKRDPTGKVIALIPPAYTKAAPQTRLEIDDEAFQVTTEP